MNTYAADFVNALNEFAIANKSEHKQEHYYVMKGRKYTRIVNGSYWKGEEELTGTRCVCFIDDGGNILKSASWKTPAKGVRGHVDNMDQCGIVQFEKRLITMWKR